MRRPLILAAAISALPLNAAAQAAVTLYGGYRAGGGFTDVDTDDAVDVKGSGAFALAIDLPFDASRQLQFYVSRQNSEFDVSAPPGSPLSAINGQSMSVTYFHFGGTNFFEGLVGRGPYVVGGVGATLLEPGLNGYSSEWRPSIGIGLGYQWPLAYRVALRFEVRGYMTLVNSNGGLFCSGGCVVAIKGDSFSQADAQIGLSFGF